MPATVLQKNTGNTTERAPVVVVMGHIDHGKSKLLDYIRKTNIVEGETGGITQRLSAYEVEHNGKRITFLDTPGHEAFQSMRYRGAEVADIAVLIVAADEGVKAQTLEAYKQIKECGLPAVVALNKIDKSGSNVEKTKNQLLEHGIYLEGLGGNIPSVAISATEGTGVDELLDMILLVAEVEELKGDATRPAEGVVIESHRDPKRGITATLIVKDGTLETGMAVAAGASISSVRIMEDFQGNRSAKAVCGSPVRVVGFDSVPAPGERFRAYLSKKEAERAVSEQKKSGNHGDAKNTTKEENDEHEYAIFPIVLKADTEGSLDAIAYEIQKIPRENVRIQIVQQDVGAVSENDIKRAAAKAGTAVVGFNTTIDATARERALREHVDIVLFDIIYKLSEWVGKEVRQRAPQTEERVVGRAKILKTFSSSKQQHVVGGTVLEGTIRIGERVRIVRRDAALGEGTITNLQQHKANTKHVAAENEFGAQIKTKTDIAAGDIIESTTITP